MTTRIQARGLDDAPESSSRRVGHLFDTIFLAVASFVAGYLVAMRSWETLAFEVVGLTIGAGTLWWRIRTSNPNEKEAR